MIDHVDDRNSDFEIKLVFVLDSLTFEDFVVRAGLMTSLVNRADKILDSPVKEGKIRRTQTNS
jgi:hypothetical protein